MPGNRTIPRLWRDAVARNTGAGVPRRGGRRVARGPVGRGRGARRVPRQRPARPRRPQGRRVRHPRAEHARVGAVRLRARARRRGRGRDLRELVAARRALRPRALRGGRPSCARTTRSAPRSRTVARRSHSSTTCSPSPTCPRSRRRAARTGRRTPRRSTRPSRRSTRRTCSPSSTRRERRGRRRAA